MSDPKTPAEALAHDMLENAIRKPVKDKHLWDNEDAEEEPWE